MTPVADATTVRPLPIARVPFSLRSQSDKSGEISTDRLKEILNDFELTINIQEYLDEYDKDQSGTIDYEEFKSILT